MLNYALQEGRNGMAVFAEGLREFEVIGEEKTFAITLLRGVGLLGKEICFKAQAAFELNASRTHNCVVCFLVLKFIELYRYANRRWCSSAGAGIADSVQCYNKIPWDAMKLNKAGFNVPESYSLLKMPQWDA